MEHHEYSPSKYNAWAECPAWEGSKKDTAESTAGTNAHEELRKGLENPDYVPDNYAARWARDKVLELADGAEVKCEVRVEGTMPGVDGIFGTVDVTWKDKCGVVYVADFKTFSDGTTDYFPQLRGYAALIATPYTLDWPVNLVVLHGGVCKMEEITTEFSDCLDRTLEILKSVRSSGGRPHLCKWCQFCGRIGSCSESNGALQVVSDNGVAFSRLSICQKLVVLDTVDKLSKTIREDAKKMANDNGGVLEMDGIRYEMKPWAGKPKVRDLCEVAASVASPKYLKVNERKGEAVEVEMAGLTHEELLKLCDLGKTALANALIEKNPTVAKADVKRYVEQFFESTEGTPHFVRVL